MSSADRSASLKAMRDFDIVIEKVGDQIQVIAEGHTMLAQRFDRVEARLDTMDARFDTMGGRLARVEDGLVSFREEVRAFKADTVREFGEVKAMVKLSYAELDGRLRLLEHEVGDLRSRLERLEARVPAGAVS